MVSITRLKSSQIKHDVHFVNDGLILSKINNKAECAFGMAILLLTCCSQSDHDILAVLISNFSSKYDHFGSKLQNVDNAKPMGDVTVGLQSANANQRCHFLIKICLNVRQKS